jgi:hypothetical protein
MIETYLRPISTTIIELMQAAFGPAGALFQHYYDGDPVHIPAQNLPCMIIEKQSTVLPGQAPTGMMRLDHTITIQAEFDKRPEFNKNPKQVYLRAKLEQIAEGIDPNTGEVGLQTIVGVLQRNFTLRQQANGQTLEINYALFPRGRDVLTQGVTVTATIREDRILTGRI